ncbi:MAG: PCRF domain-containing protein [Ilumatobacteraceae bacterium]
MDPHRLRALQDEFVSLESSLSDPDIVSDQARLRDVSRRYKDLTPVVDCIRRLQAAPGRRRGSQGADRDGQRRRAWPAA